MFNKVLYDKKLQYESDLEGISNGIWHLLENPKPLQRFQTATSLLFVP